MNVLMRKFFGGAAAVVFLVAFGLAIWGGGRNIFESPIATIPSILIDYRGSETEIFIHGLNDFRYTNMSIEVSNDTESYNQSRESTYFIYYSTAMTNFSVNISVWNKNKEYIFNGTVKVYPTEAYPKVLTINEIKRNGSVDDHTLNIGDLPWKKLMERAK